MTVGLQTLTKISASLQYTAPLRLTFTFQKDADIVGPDLEARRTFWHSQETVQWFKQRGYTLYKRLLEDYGEFSSRLIPALPSEEYREADYPYAYHDSEMVEASIKPFCAHEFEV